jgi:hypothetical protein
MFCARKTQWPKGSASRRGWRKSRKKITGIYANKNERFSANVN